MSFEWITPEIAHMLIKGLQLTLWLTVATSLGSLVIGVFIGVMKISGSRSFRFLSEAFIEIHRNVPALVLIIFWAFAFPNLLPLELKQRLFFENPYINGFGEWAGLSIPYYTIAAGLALTLNTSAYLAEIFRAGVTTIPRENIDTARTLGANRWAILWNILIPQGMRAAFPAISTRLIHNMKNTALAAIVATPEFFHSIQTGITRSFRAIELLTLAGFFYLLFSLGMAALLRAIDIQLNRKPDNA